MSAEAARQRFLDHLAEHMDEIAAATAEAIRSSIPAYAKAWDLVGAGVRNVVRVTNLKLLELWRNRRQSTPEELAWLGRIGVPPEQTGISLDDTLHAYRISAGMIWDSFSKASLLFPDLDTSFLLEAAMIGFYNLNDLSIGISREGTHRARERLRRREDAERSLIEALLARPPRIEEATTLARVLGITLGGSWRIAVATPGVASENLAEQLSLLVEALRKCLSGATAQLDPVAVIGGRVVAALGEGTSLDATRVGGALIGIGGEHVGPTGFVESYEEAREALEIAVANRVGVASFDDLWLDRLLTGSLSLPDLTRMMLTPLDSLPERKRRDWEHTLEVYLESGGNLTTVGRRLHVHPHTVRYRLAQLRELLGPVLDSPDHRLALQIALRARRLQTA